LNDQPTALSTPEAAAGPAGVKGGNRTLLWVLGALALLLAIYAAAGILWAPRLIKQEAQAWTTKNLGLDLALGEVKVDPFRLRVELNDIAIPARDPMVAVKHVSLDFAGRSLFSDSYRFDDIRVVRPQVKAILGADGKLNLMKLMPPPNDDPFPPVMVANLEVENGAAYLADNSKPNRPDTNLTPISFRLQNLHTTRDEGGGFRLDGVSDAGEEFVWRGKVSMAPIASEGGLAIRRLKAASIHEFVGDLLPVVLKDGQIDLDLGYTASYGDAGFKAKAVLPKLGISALKFGGTPQSLNADIAVAGLGVAGLKAEAEKPAGGDLVTRYGVGGLAARNLSLTGTGPAKGQALALKSADVTGIAFDPATGTPVIGTVRLAGLDSTFTRDRRGDLPLLRVLPTRPVTTAYSADTPNPRIREFSLSDARIRVVDQAVKPVTSWTITPLTITARGTGDGLAGPMKINVDGRVNGATSFALAGDVDPGQPGRGPSADLAVRLANFPIKAGVPYTVDFPRLEIVSGTASADGRLRYGPKAMGYKGRASVDNLKLIETYQRTNLVSWKRLQMDGIDATPRGATVERINLVAPASTLIILQDGTVNFQRLVTFNPQPIVTPAADAAPPPKLTRAQRRAEEARLEAEKKATAAEARAALAAPIVEPDIPVLVKRLNISGGTMDFADYSLRPNFGARIEGVRGTISNISNSPRAVAQVKLDGYVIDKFSPVTIAGELTPLQYDRRTRIDMAFRNIELPVFNPYSGRWAGYSIAKGKLTTELGYTIDNRALDAKHHIVIDQLEWGEATDSKEKVSMPIKFATSLLKDKNGVIELDVPVTGTLDDPSFKLGPIIWKVIGNLMEKVITAPFRALGDLFGGKEDVQFVDFAPGSASIPSAATSNLAGIAKGLTEKPELRLDIPSGPGLPLDAVGLADQKIAAAAMAKEVKKGQPADLAALELDKRHDRLEDLYKVRFKTGPKYPDPEAKDGEKEGGDARRQRETDWLLAELRKSYAPSPDELAALGKARAEAVRLALLEGATPVDPARVFLSGRDSAAEKEGKARMELKLEGS
jgi:hypothetical protein